MSSIFQKPKDIFLTANVDRQGAKEFTMWFNEPFKIGDVITHDEYDSVPLEVRDVKGEGSHWEHLVEIKSEYNDYPANKLVIGVRYYKIACTLGDYNTTPCSSSNMERSGRFKILFPKMPNSIRYEDAADKKQKYLPIKEMNNEEAEQYSELLKQEWYNHWKKKVFNSAI